MITKKYKGVWFYGFAGSGKTAASKFLKKKIKNSIILDGDEIRKYISFDLGYTLRERKIQIKRVFGLVNLSLESKIFPLVSTVYMDGNMKQKLKKKKIFLINVVRNFKDIKNRKKIYNKNTNNVVGVDIKMPKIKNEFIIENNSSIKIFQKKLQRIIYD